MDVLIVCRPAGFNFGQAFVVVSNIEDPVGVVAQEDVAWDKRPVRARPPFSCINPSGRLDGAVGEEAQATPTAANQEGVSPVAIFLY